MKKFLNLPTLLLVAISAMFMVSCADDPIDPTDPTNVPPAVTLTSSADITVEPGATFTADFTSSKGSDSPLKAVTVYEDGLKVPTSRLAFNGVAAAANPLLVTGDDVDGLTWSVDIVAASTAGVVVVYEIEVQDEAGGKNSALINVTISGTPPTLTATPPTEFSIVAGSTNDFKLTGAKGTGELVSIEVRENGELVDASRLSWDGESMVGTNNPFLLADGEKDGFEESRLGIKLPMEVGEFIYTMTLTDEFSLTSSVTYTVTTTPFINIETREGVLLNSAGPAGTGGLDLDTGDGTGSMDSAAEIRDNGIDDNLPEEQNWLRTISPANNAQMKYLVPGQNGLSETFMFANINVKEDLPGLFGNGVDLVGGATSEVQIEDVFIVERDGSYWLLEVVEIVTDPSGNEDSYKFNIKY